jgi:hypothetical protein
LLSQYIENFYYGGIGKPAVEIKKNENENEKKSEEKNEHESRETSALGSFVVISKDNRKNSKSKISNSKVSTNAIVDDNDNPVNQNIPERLSNVSTFLDLPLDSTYLDLPVNMLTEQQVR